MANNWTTEDWFVCETYGGVMNAMNYVGEPSLPAEGEVCWDFAFFNKHNQGNTTYPESDVLRWTKWTFQQLPKELQQLVPAEYILRMKSAKI